MPVHGLTLRGGSRPVVLKEAAPLPGRDLPPTWPASAGPAPPASSPGRGPERFFLQSELGDTESALLVALW